MHYTLTDIHARITCTYADLVKMDALDMGIYATPTTQGAANQLYMSTRPNFQDDFLLASVEDFLAEEGIDTLGWQEMSEGEMVLAEEHTPPMTITVPRRKAGEQA